MEFDPQEVPPYRTSDKTSFAFVSARDRWPVILTGAIDDVHRAVAACQGDEKIKEGKRIIEGLTKLKYELQHDRKMTPLIYDGEHDVDEYNKELELLGSPSWFGVPWLYSECYLYRRMSIDFHLSQDWQNYDVFAKQKMSTFKSSRPAVLELAAKYKELVDQLKSASHPSEDAQEREKAEEMLFAEMCEICLWGNATDLSLLTSLTYEDIQKLQGSEARKAAEKNILVNDIPLAFQALKRARRENPKADRRVDIVLDNAGFELFVDLILAGYLVAANLATHIVLHPKAMPWFVSDVTPEDISSLINALADPQTFYTTLSEDEKQAGIELQPLSEAEEEDLAALFRHWMGLYSEGQLNIRPNGFWTQAGSYWRLPKAAPSVYADLKESELVIFKGDLNYRKLTGDVMWPPTTPFSKAIGTLGPGSGIRTLALRTCKADVVVGLPDGEDERLRGMEGGGGDSGARKWAWSGKWAVVQFCDGKS